MKPFSEPEQLKDQLELTTVCLVCSKPLKKQAKGSLTGWIFDNDYRAITDRWMCSCAPGSAPAVKLQVTSDAAATPANASTTHELAGMSPTDGAPVLRKTLLNTTIAGRWLITSVLDSGRMGTVYVGQDITNQRPVAIKVVRSELSANARIVKRFLQECEKAASIAHHNICVVYDSGKLDDGAGFVVTDYIEGENLETKISKEGFLDVDEALELFIQLSLALEHAHANGVIHRGLKPTNILISAADDSPKLVDFGIAKAIPSLGKETVQLSAIADIFGDPSCMSPEQCLGDNLDQRSDIYSLGCVMYQALTGKPPFLFANGCQTAMAHVSQLPPPFAETMYNCDLPAPLEAVVMRALEKDADDRYQSMAQLRADLETLKRGGTPSIPKPKRAGKKRVLQLPRADVVIANANEANRTSGTMVAHQGTAVATTKAELDRAKLIRRRNLILVGIVSFLVIMCLCLLCNMNAWVPHLTGSMLHVSTPAPVPKDQATSAWRDPAWQGQMLDFRFCQSARKFYDQGQYQKAIDEYSKAIKVDAADPQPYIGRGLAYEELGDNQKAVNEYTQAINLDPNQYEPYSRRARSYLALERYADAINDASSAIRLSNKADDYDTRAQAYTRLRQYNQAIDDCVQAIKIDPTDVLAYTNRAHIFARQKKYALALQDYDKLLSIGKYDAFTYLNRAWMYIKSKQLDKALSDANKAISLDPKLAYGYDARGYAELVGWDAGADTKVLEKSVSDFTTAIKLDPTEAVIYEHRSLAYEKLGKNDLSRKDHDKAAQLGYDSLSLMHKNRLQSSDPED